MLGPTTLRDVGKQCWVLFQGPFKKKLGRGGPFDLFFCCYCFGKKRGEGEG